MAIIRLQENVPEIYVNQSRDFQLLCRLYDCIINGVKYDIDSLIYTLDTSSCSNNLLQLLQNKLGFFTDADITDEQLRYVVQAFPYLVKNKGSRKAIVSAVNMFLKLNHMKTGAYIDINNDTADYHYTVKIGIESSIKDTTILTEVFKYILPPGYEIYYYFYTGIELSDMKLKFGDDLNLQISSVLSNALVRENNYDKINRYKSEVEITQCVNIVDGYYNNDNFYSNPQFTAEIQVIGASDHLYYLDKNTGDYYVCRTLTPSADETKFYKVTMADPITVSYTSNSEK